MGFKLFFCLLAVGYVECLQYHYVDNRLGDLPWERNPWPLAVLAERRYSLSRDMASVPVLAVPSHEMALLSKPYVSSYSPHSNLVTCRLNKFSMEAVPAVRVELPMPVLLTGEEGLLRFPSHLHVEAQGIRFAMPVGALLAPVPDEPYSPYHMLNVVYAVPAVTYADAYHIPQYPSYVPLSYPTPNRVTSSNIGGHKVTTYQPQTPITILEFPSKITAPPSLLRPEPEDEELVNRGPPENLVVPAGLVQSTQPKPLHINFVNSKESPFLQTFREEANKHRDYTGKPVVEAL